MGLMGRCLDEEKEVSLCSFSPGLFIQITAISGDRRNQEGTVEHLF